MPVTPTVSYLPTGLAGCSVGPGISCGARKLARTPRVANNNNNNLVGNHLGGGPVVRAWDQEICSLCGFRFEPCDYSYDGHWRFTWSLTSGPVGLIEVRASWPGHPR
jgi:hypothetical protein